MKKELKINNDCSGMYEEEIIETILKSRGIENVNEFLNPGIEYIHNPFELYRMNEAVQVVVDAIKDKLNVLIQYDVDTDGITSGTECYRFLKDVGIECDTYINEKKIHGTTDEFIEYCKDYDLIIIVDSLDSKIDNYKKLKDAGKTVIVLDHHNVDENKKYDDYIILVSSNRKYHNKELSGSGVVFQFIRAIDLTLGTTYSENYYDLAICGIIADMMDMTVMENRAIAYKGFNNIVNPAIKKICGGFGFDGSGIRFSVAPKVNSANRLNKNNEALEMFKTDNVKEMNAYLKVLEKAKEDQNFYVNKYIDDIMGQVSSQENDKCVVIFMQDDLPKELSGLIGNKVLSITNRPTVILKENGDNYTGSMRAIGVEDFNKLCKQAGFCQVDGHPNSAGFFCTKKQFPIFKNNIENILKDIEFSSEEIVDAKIDVEDITDYFINKVKEVDLITGKEFEQLSFCCDIDDYEVSDMSNGKHLKLIIGESNLIFIKWNFDGSWDELEEAAMFGQTVRCYGTLRNGFFGRTYYRQFIMDSFEILA